MANDDSFITFLSQHWPRGPHAVNVETADDVPAGSHSTAAPTAVGRFQIRRRLGSGGFATVYLSYDPQFDREVALKVPHPETSRSDDLRRRFEREARAVASLDHPHINPIYETSDSGASELYIASHYCAGRTLADWLKRRLAAVAPRSAARLVATLARAVQHAHDRGILHRDLKPSNVLLEPVGQSAAAQPAADTFEGFIPRLCDFGLARILEEADDNRTRTGTLVGTPRYMAPEQAIGAASQVGPRSDIYALGVILYELLVGRPPFVGDTELETLRQVRSDEPISIRRLQPMVPRDLDTIALKCLEKEPARRYQTAGELAADLERFSSDRPIEARPKSLARRARLWTRRHPVQSIVLLAGLLVALGLPAGLAWHSVGLQRAFRVAEEERIRAETFEARSRQNEQAALANAANVEQHVYASDMRLVSELLQEGDYVAAADLIDRHDPEVTGGKDRRGFEWWYFRPFRELTRHTWQAHDGPQSLLAFSANGEVLLTASDSDGRARTWQVATGQALAEIGINKAGDPGQHRAGALSPDGTLAATVIARNTVAVWDAASGEIKAQLQHSDRVRCVTFSPDGARLLTGGDDSTKIWRCGQWRTTEHELVPTRLARFAPDGRSLAIVWALAFASSVHLIDATSFQELREIPSWFPILDIAYSPDARMLGTVSDGPLGTAISMYNPDSGAWLSNAHWRGDRLQGVSFAAGARLLATVAQDGGVRFWSPALGLPRGGMRMAGGPIRAFSFSSDGRWLATSAGGAVSLWAQRLFGGPRSLEVAAPCAAPVVFSPTEQRVAAATTDGGLLVVDATTCTVELRLRGPIDPIADIAFSADGSMLAGVDGRQLWVWSTEDGQPLWQIKASGARCVCWSPDAATLVTGGDDHLLRLWDASGRSLLKTFDPGHSDAVLGVCCAADGEHVLSYGRENTVRTWDVATGKQDRSPIVSDKPLMGLELLGADLSVAIQTVMGEVTLWKFNASGEPERFGSLLKWPKGSAPWYLNQQGSLAASPVGPLLGRVGPGDLFIADDVATGARQYAFGGREIAPISIAYSSDGRTLAAVGRGGQLTLWDTSTWRGRQVRGAPLATVRALTFLGDGTSLAIATDGSPPTGERGYSGFPAWPTVRLPIASNHPSPTDVAPSQRDYVPWRDSSASLRIWDIATEQEQYPLEQAEIVSMLPAVAWAGRREMLGGVTRDGTVLMWDMHRGAIAARWHLDERIQAEIEGANKASPGLVSHELIARIKGPPQLAFSPAGNTLATISPSGEVKLWNAADWRVIAALPETVLEPRSVFFSPDGGTLVVISTNRARFYDPKTLELRRNFGDELPSEILCGGYSPDGKILVLATAAGSTKCYDARSGRLTKTLVGHVDGIGSLAFAPDGQTLATGGWDTTVRLWNLESGREVAVLEGHRGRVHAVAFSPDGSVLASGGEIEGGLGELFLWRGKVR